MTETMKLIDEDFKSAIMTIVKDFKNMCKMRKEMDTLKKSQVIFLELKIKISDMKN